MQIFIREIPKCKNQSMLCSIEVLSDIFKEMSDFFLTNTV